MNNNKITQSVGNTNGVGRETGYINENDLDDVTTGLQTMTIPIKFVGTVAEFVQNPPIFTLTPDQIQLFRHAGTRTGKNSVKNEDRVGDPSHTIITGMQISGQLNETHIDVGVDISSMQKKTLGAHRVFSSSIRANVKSANTVDLKIPDSDVTTRMLKLAVPLRTMEDDIHNPHSEKETNWNIRVRDEWEDGTMTPTFVGVMLKTMCAKGDFPGLNISVLDESKTAGIFGVPKEVAQKLKEQGKLASEVISKSITDLETFQVEVSPLNHQNWAEALDDELYSGELLDSKSADGIKKRNKMKNTRKTIAMDLTVTYGMLDYKK